MARRNTDTTPPIESRGLVGDDLERAIRAFAWQYPEHVVHQIVAPDGRVVARGIARREVPAQGANSAVPPGELPARYAEAVAQVRLRVGEDGRVTAAAIAAELGVSPRTVDRYRKRLGLG